jgi:hypothetical protein
MAERKRKERVAKNFMLNSDEWKVELCPSRKYLSYEDATREVIRIECEYE